VAVVVGVSMSELLLLATFFIMSLARRQLLVEAIHLQSLNKAEECALARHPYSL
jgi:hypothetical protein